MSINRNLSQPLFKVMLCMALFTVFVVDGFGKNLPLEIIFKADTTTPAASTNLPYPITDRRGDNLSISNYNSFNYFQPSNQKE